MLKRTSKFVLTFSRWSLFTETYSANKSCDVHTTKTAFVFVIHIYDTIRVQCLCDVFIVIVTAAFLIKDYQYFKPWSIFFIFLILWGSFIPSGNKPCHLFIMRSSYIWMVFRKFWNSCICQCVLQTPFKCIWFMTDSAFLLCISYFLEDFSENNIF